MSALIDPARSNGPLNVVIAGSAPGTPGEQGLPGKNGAGIVSMSLSEDGILTATLSDGTTISCNAASLIANAAQLAAQSIGAEFLDVKQQAQTASSNAANALQLAKSAMPVGDYALDPRSGLLTLLPPPLMLPDGLTLNGAVFMVPDGVSLPIGLSSNGGVVMTDGKVRYKGAYSNGGVLCSLS